jgi:hypothetical protein
MLNCPFCPSQAFPANVQALNNIGLTKLRCIASGHECYVSTEEIYGRKSEPDTDSLPQQS